MVNRQNIVAEVVIVVVVVVVNFKLNSIQALIVRTYMFILD